MKKIVLLFLTAFLLYGCPPDCDDMLYETGPPMIHVELIDATSEENIFTNQLFSSDDLQITDLDGNELELRFIGENNYNIIQLIPYRYDDENTIFIKLGDEINIELEFDVEEYEGECSSSFYIEELAVENYSYEINNENGILRIKI